MDSKKIHQALLLILLVMNFVSTTLLYTNNFLDFDKYPSPAWITPNGVYMSWIALTSIGTTGYFLYIKNILWLAYFCLGIYSLTGISSLGHYFFPATKALSVKMNALTWLDASANISLLSFTIWLAMRKIMNYEFTIHNS